MTEAENKLIFVFNTCYFDLIKELNALHADLKKGNRRHYKVVDKMSKEYIDNCAKTWSPAALQALRELDPDAVLQNADVTEMPLLIDLPIKNVLMLVDRPDYPHQLLMQLYMLALVLSIYVQELPQCPTTADRLLDKVLTLTAALQNEEADADAASTVIKEGLDEIIDDDYRSLLLHMQTLARRRTKTNARAAGAGTEAGAGASDPIRMIENSKLGALAKEISEEIDLSQLKLEKPEDMFNLANLGSENNVLGSIVSKVGSKIQTRLSQGDIKHDELLKEAFSLLSSFGGMGGSGSGGSGSTAGGMDTNPLSMMMNNPMMQDLMKAATAATTPASSQGTRSTTRDRLRKKLADKS
jgi:hypothetical protein